MQRCTRMNEHDNSATSPDRIHQTPADLRELLVLALERHIADRSDGNPVLNRLEAESRADQLLAPRPKTTIAVHRRGAP